MKSFIAGVILTAAVAGNLTTTVLDAELIECSGGITGKAIHTKTAAFSKGVVIGEVGSKVNITLLPSTFQIESEAATFQFMIVNDTLVLIKVAEDDSYDLLQVWD